MDTSKAPLPNGPDGKESPKKESELRASLAIVLGAILMIYFEKRFPTWFGLSNPSALALAVLSAWTVVGFVQIPSKLFGYTPERPRVAYFLVVIALSLVAFLVGRILHF